MSVKFSRIAAIVGALAVAGAMSIFTAASASAAVTPITEANCPEPPNFFGAGHLTKPVNGSLTVKKLNQSVELKGGQFGALLGLCLEPGPKLTASLTEGTIVFPPFTAPLKLGNIAAEVGMEIKQFGPGEGTVTGSLTGEECTPTTCNAEGEPLVELNVPAEANIAFHSLKVFGLTLPLTCETATPIHLPFVKHLTLNELLNGTTITGESTMPPVKCQGALGFVEGAVLTALFSGPENPFSLTFGETIEG